MTNRELFRHGCRLYVAHSMWSTKIWRWLRLLWLWYRNASMRDCVEEYRGSMARRIAEAEFAVQHGPPIEMEYDRVAREAGLPYAARLKERAEERYAEQERLCALVEKASAMGYATVFTFDMMKEFVLTYDVLAISSHRFNRRVPPLVGEALAEATGFDEIVVVGPLMAMWYTWGPECDYCIRESCKYKKCHLSRPRWGELLINSHRNSPDDDKKNVYRHANFRPCSYGYFAVGLIRGYGYVLIAEWE